MVRVLRSVYSAGHVGLLQNATYSQGEAELKGITVPSELTEEEGNGSNMITITGEDGLVYQVRVYTPSF